MKITCSRSSIIVKSTVCSRNVLFLRHSWPTFTAIPLAIKLEFSRTSPVYGLAINGIIQICI